MQSRFRALFLIFCLVLITACALPAAPLPSSVPVVATATSESTLVPSSTPPSTATTAATRSAATTTPGTTGAVAKVPNSCSELEALVGPYIGGVATTKSLGSPQHLSCEFANAKASTIAIVDIGVGGTLASFNTLKSISAQGGRTVTPINGLGAVAFSVSKNGVTAGVSVLTTQGIVYVVESNLTLDQDEALIQQLMKLP